MKILITGHLGMVGSAVYERLQPNHIVRGADRDTVDLADYQATKQIFLEFNPDFIVHCAGQGDVDFCEKNNLSALKDNFQVTRNIASLCAEWDCGILFCSTDHVYRYQKLPWNLREYNATEGASYYGFTKTLCEKEIIEKVKKHFICRLCWQYGLIRREVPKDLRRVGMVDIALLAYRDNKPYTIISSSVQYTSNVYDTADVFTDMIEGKLPYGIYNVTSENELNIRGIYMEIFRHLGLSENEASKLIITQDAETYHLTAEPFNLKLCNYRMPSFEEGLDRYFREIFPNVHF